MKYYTYRVIITEQNEVRVQKVDFDNDLRAKLPPQPFGYKIHTLGPLIDELSNYFRNNTSKNPEKVFKLGESLFTALLNELLCHDFFTFYEEHVKKEDTLLYVELDVDERVLPGVAALPWEFMCSPRGKGYRNVWIGTDSNLIFLRRYSLQSWPKPIQLRVNEKLRVALVIAAPEDEKQVKYEEIVEALNEVDQIEVSLVKHATPRNIDDLLRQNQPHILHFIGHGRFFREENQDEIGKVALVEATGLARWTDAYTFSAYLNSSAPYVIILQACEGAMSSSEAFVSVASQLVQQRIPVVIAMQYEISNFVAKQFVLKFYHRLFEENDPVGKAVQEARRFIALGPKGYDTRDFATPVLFMSVKDKPLFTEPPFKPVIKAFGNNTRPIFVIYGIVPYFEEIINGFREHFQESEKVIYLVLNMEIAKHNTLAETLLEIVQQLVSQLIQRISESEQKNKLYEMFYKLHHLRERIESKIYEPEDKLGEFVSFAESQFYPILKAICKRDQKIIIGCERFEKVAQQGSKIRNFFLEKFVEEFWFVLFFEADDKPSLYYGSNEEHTLENITFYKL